MLAPILTMLLSFASVGVDLPDKVAPAKGFVVASPVARRQPMWSIELETAKVQPRNRHKILEWRDPQQTHAIFWTARTNGYIALEIKGDRYAPLPGDQSKEGRPNVHATYWVANEAVKDHWKLMTGRKIWPKKLPDDIRAHEQARLHHRPGP